MFIKLCVAIFKSEILLNKNLQTAHDDVELYQSLAFRRTVNQSKNLQTPSTCVSSDIYIYSDVTTTTNSQNYPMRKICFVIYYSTVAVKQVWGWNSARWDLHPHNPITYPFVPQIDSQRQWDNNSAISYEGWVSIRRAIDQKSKLLT